MSCGVGCRCDSNMVVWWWWCRLAAVALIQPLAQEPPYATSAPTLQKKKDVAHMYNGILLSYKTE